MIEEYRVKLEEAEYIRLESDSVKIVILDNILSYLPYYTRALQEAYRVATEKVIVILPEGLSHTDVISRDLNGIYHNKYEADKFLCMLRNFNSEHKTIMSTLYNRNTQIEAMIEKARKADINQTFPSNAENPNTPIIKCDICGFVAKSKTGLVAHTRKHKNTLNNNL